MGNCPNSLPQESGIGGADLGAARCRGRGFWIQGFRFSVSSFGSGVNVWDVGIVGFEVWHCVGILRTLSSKFTGYSILQLRTGGYTVQEVLC